MKQREVNIGNTSITSIPQNILKLEMSGRLRNGTNKRKLCSMALVSITMIIMLVGIAGAAPFAYITNYGGNTVSIIDTATDTILKDLTVGENPIGVAVNPTGTKAYVTNSNSQDVSVIDTTTNAVIDTVPVENSPQGAAINPAGTKVYVTQAASNGDGTVSVIDTNSNTVEVNVPVGESPCGVAVNPEEPKVYVTNFMDYTVSVIDTDSNTVVGTLPVGAGPKGIAVTPDGTKVYVADNTDGTVSVIDTGTNIVISTVPVGNGPEGIAVNSEGTRVYVANSAEGTVSIIDTNTNTVMDTVTIGDGPGGVAVNPDGTKVYVANIGSNDVSVIDTDTNAVIETVNGLNNPYAFGQFIGGQTVQPVHPVANFSSNVTSGNAPLAVQFNDSSENADNLTWDFGDGDNSTEKNPLHIYSAVGNYTVNLTASNANGANSKTAKITVTASQSSFHIGQYAYITNFESNNISVIDTETDTVVATLDGGQGPNGVAVTSDGKKAYVTNEEGTVSVIDAINKTVTATVIVGKSPYGVAVTPDGKKVYVANWASNNISVIDTATNTVITSLTGGVSPIGVAVTPDGKKVYVANNADKNVSIIDTTTDTVIGTVDVGSGPGGVAVSQDGTKVYVGNYDSGNISIIDTATDTVTATVTVGTGPYGITVTPDGKKVYVANQGNDNVSVIDAINKAVTATVNVGTGPYGVAVTPDGKKVYVANEGSDNVSVINTTTDTVVNTVPVGTSPNALGQFIYSFPMQPVLPVANFSSNVTSGNAPLAIQFNDSSENADAVSWDFDNDGTPESTDRNPVYVYTTPGSYTVNLTVTSANGNNSTLANITVLEKSVEARQFAYITNGLSNNVSVIDTATDTVVATVPVGQVPWGVAVNPNRTNVYVANSYMDNTVSVINIATNTVIANVPVGSDPTGIAVTPDGKNVYVTNWGSDNVSVINTTTNTVIATVDVDYPFGVAVKPDGTKAYVTNFDGNVSVINTTTNQVTAKVKVGNSPFGVAVTPDGTKVYVTNQDSNNVSVIDIATNTVTATIDVGTSPHGVAVTPDGTKVYVANEGSNNVSVISTTNNSITDTVDVGERPYGVGFNLAGTKAYVANQDSDNVSIIDTITNTVIDSVPVGDNPFAFGQFIGEGQTEQPILPVANFSSNVTSGNAPLAVQFNDSSENADNVTWNFGDGNNTSERNPVHIFFDAGTYTVNLTATNASGTNSTFATITVSEQPVLSYTIDKVVADVAGKGPSGSVSKAGDVITYHVKVTNDGNVDLKSADFTNITLNDSLTTLTDPIESKNGDSVLEVGEYVTYTGKYTVTQADIDSNGEGDGFINNTATIDSDRVGLKSDSADVLIDTAGVGPYAYITNMGDDTVSVINTATNTVTAVVPVGNEPYGVVVNPAKTKVYVTNYGNNTVSVIDTSTNNVIATVPVGNYPAGIAVSLDGTKVYVTNVFSNTVSVIDTTSNTVTDTVPVGINPAGVAVNPNGTEVYVTNFNNNTISVIDRATNTVTATVPVGVNPCGVAVSPDGSNVYVTNSGNGTVDVIYTYTNEIIKTIPVGNGPRGILVNPAGTNVYVANNGSDTVSVINTTTNNVTDTVNVGNYPYGVSVNPNGTEVYVTNYGSNTVSVIDTVANNVIGTINVGVNPVAFGQFIYSFPMPPVLPVANFSSNVTEGHVPLAVQFNDNSENATDLRWDFDYDGTPDSIPGSIDKNPIHVYEVPGTYTVNLTASNANGTDSKVDTINVLKAVPEINWSNPGDMVYGTELNNTQLNAEVSVPGNLVYTPAPRTILGVGQHILQVDFTPEDSTNYTSASENVSINVLQATPEINWSNPDDVVYGTALNYTQLNAEALVNGTSIPGNFNYNPEIGAVLSGGQHTLHVVFTPEDIANYTTASKDISINVLQATPEIKWNNPEDIVYGTALSSTQLNASSVVKGQLTYTPDVETVLGVGTHTLNVDLTPEDTANYTTASKSVSINVTKATPEITWSNPTDIVYETALSSTQLNASSVVKGELTYTPDVGTVLGVGTHTLNVDFTPEDIANYSSVSKNITINVLQATPEITWSDPEDIVYGKALNDTQLNAEASVNGTLVYTPAKDAVLGVGQHILQANFTPEDSANFSSASKNVSINVQKATPEINWSNPADITYGTELNKDQLNAEVSVPGNLVYNPAQGTILGVGVQILNVDFTPEDTANYTNASKNVSINILQATPEINWNNLADIVYGTALNDTQLNAETSVNGTFVYTPTNGTVLGVGTHTLNLDFTPEDSANYSSVSKNISINVLSATPEITWNNPADITYGTELNKTQLDASASVNGTFVYNPAEGTLLGVGTQTLQVDFAPEDSANYTNASKNVTINVLQATPEINWSNPGDIVYGTELNNTQLNASASVPGIFVYTPDVGTVLGVGTHTLNVDFTPEDIANYSSVSKNITINVLQATPEITWSDPEDIVYGTALNDTQLNAEASVKGTFVYNPTEGNVLGVGAHTLEVDFTPADTANYSNVSKSVSINVLQATPEINWSNPDDVVYGTALNYTQLNAEASVNGTSIPGNLTYTPAQGTILGAGNQTLHVDFTPEDTANCTTASKDVAINVLQATPEITWNNPEDIVYGTELNDTQLNAEVSVPGNLTYTPAQGTILGAGKQTLHVDFIPEDNANYSNVSENVAINILQATPEINWSKPADIVYRTALNDKQLNALASVNGTFVYAPEAGTILGIGEQNLNVDFTPEDTANYTNASKSVSINVLNASYSIFKSVIAPDETGDCIVNSAGDKIPYRIVVKNEGDENLTNVTVSDPMITLTGPAGNDIDPEVLNPGETWVYTGIYKLTSDDINNESNNISNAATVSCNELPEKSSSVDTPIAKKTGLSIYKSVIGIDEAGDYMINEPGDVINYQVAVRNDGNVKLTRVSVNDPMVKLTGPTGDHNKPGILDPGETWVYTGNYTVTQMDVDSNGNNYGLIENTATVSCKELSNESSSKKLPIIRIPPVVVTPESNGSNALPTVDFSTNTTSGNAPLSVQFTDLSRNAASRSWDFNNDGAADSAEISPVYTYIAPGIYTANLTVSNANGNVSKNATITVLQATSSSTNSGSSGSSGSGSSGGTGGSYEPASNVEVKEISQAFITNGSSVKFDFPKNATSVVYLSFDSKKKAGKTTTIVEMLKGKSTFVSELPSEEVYKSLNIWVGNSGFATPNNIENAVVCFKVEKAWIEDKKIDKSSITLNRYSDKKWEQLSTSLLREDNKYLYFTAKTPGFSPFAITGKTTATRTEIQPETSTKDFDQENDNSAENIEQTPEQENNTNIPAKESKETPGFEIVCGIAGLLSVFLVRRKTK